MYKEEWYNRILVIILYNNSSMIINNKWGPNDKINTGVKIWF